MNIFSFYLSVVKRIRALDGITALLIRLYLAPIFIIAGYSKLQLSDPDSTGLNSLLAKPDIVAWFGNSEWGLGLPFAELLANLAAWTELFGGWLLLIGLLTRLVSIPLLLTMVVAATSVHADNGWFAITPINTDTSPAKVLTWLGSEKAHQSLKNSEQAGERLAKIKEIVADNGYPDWLYEKGNIVILNNGIEFAATYFILLLALILIGAGRFTSLDHYLYTYYLKPKLENNQYL